MVFLMVFCTKMSNQKKMFFLASSATKLLPFSALESISNEETPIAFMFNCWAITLATVVHALIPVKLPGPMFMPIASKSFGLKLLLNNTSLIVEIKNAEWYLLSVFSTIFELKILSLSLNTTYILSKQVSKTNIFTFPNLPQSLYFLCQNLQKNICGHRLRMLH